MSSYIGPERRIQDRRKENSKASRPSGRRARERRQQALSGVIGGMTANDMLALAELWKRWETTDYFNRTLPKEKKDA